MSRKITIIGSGLIGRSWAMLYAALGNCEVYIYDIDRGQIENALIEIRTQLEQLESTGLLRQQSLFGATDQFKCLKGCSDLKSSVENAYLIQECVPEDLELKRRIWQEINTISSPQTICASSTSTFLPSHINNKENFLVLHPVNPPYYVPLVEIVPGPKTTTGIVDSVRALMLEMGQVPVCLKREVPGFIVNRLQYALLNECWHLVKEGVISVKDLDHVMSDGLGMRYAFLGPLETTHLNAEGFRNYCERYANTIHAVSQDFRPLEKYSGAAIEEIARQLEEMVPLEHLQERRKWRDNCLMQLSKLKRDLF